MVFKPFEFFKNFFLTKINRKLHQIAMVFFIGVLLGGEVSLKGFVGCFLFLLAYFSTYFYNDTLDYEEDKKKIVYSEKVLVSGVISFKEFFIIYSFITVVGIFLATMWDPILGLFAVLAVLINNIRSHVNGILLRQVLLVFVELFNFEGFWVAFFSRPIPLLLVPLFISYSLSYSFGHAIYKVRETSISRVLMKKELLLFAVSTLLSFVFTLPVLFLNLYYFLMALFMLVFYSIPMLYIVKTKGTKTKEGVSNTEKTHAILVFIIGLVLFLLAFVHLFYGLPVEDVIPKKYFSGFYSTMNKIDKVQAFIFDRIFGGVSGFNKKW